MPCFRPLRGYRAASLNENGKRPIVFKKSEAFVDQPVNVPCGRCIGCRLERSRQWAIRCVHEASLYDRNAFITLTYNDENVPNDGSLNKKHFQDFMKRLRKSIEPRRVRFYHCGEYGTVCGYCRLSKDNCSCSSFVPSLGRPHYHACLFGHDFGDKVLWAVREGVPLYRSESLERLWNYGFASTGEVTFESAAYVARYIMKKITGDDAEFHYQIVQPETGEILDVEPEYTTMSRRPGIGTDWLDKYFSDVYPHDEIVINGVRMKPPRFYDRCLDEKELFKLKLGRVENAARHKEDNTSGRLRVREVVQEKRVTQLKRTMYDE